MSGDVFDIVLSMLNARHVLISEVVPQLFRTVVHKQARVSRQMNDMHEYRWYIGYNAIYAGAGIFVLWCCDRS